MPSSHIIIAIEQHSLTESDERFTFIFWGIEEDEESYWDLKSFG